MTTTFLPSASVALNVMSGALTPGAGRNGRGNGGELEGAERGAHLRGELVVAAMPASADVVPLFSYLPKIATTLSVLSSQTRWYSGYLPVVFSAERVTVALSFTTSAGGDAAAARLRRK